MSSLVACRRTPDLPSRNDHTSHLRFPHSYHKKRVLESPESVEKRTRGCVPNFEHRTRDAAGLPASPLGALAVNRLYVAGEHIAAEEY